MSVLQPDTKSNMHTIGEAIARQGSSLCAMNGISSHTRQRAKLDASSSHDIFCVIVIFRYSKYLEIVSAFLNICIQAKGSSSWKLTLDLPCPSATATGATGTSRRQRTVCHR